MNAIIRTVEDHERLSKLEILRQLAELELRSKLCEGGWNVGPSEDLCSTNVEDCATPSRFSYAFDKTFSTVMIVGWTNQFRILFRQYKAWKDA